MSDPIEFSLGEGDVKAVIRANRIIIHNPAGGVPSISFRNEQVVFQDGEPIATTKLPTTGRKLNEVITEMFTIVDPVTAQEVTVSIAGLAELIEQGFIKWFKEDEESKQ